MRLIDADELIKIYLTLCRTDFEIINRCLADEKVLAIIQNAPTVEKRQTGEWIHDGFCVTTTQYKCNKCRMPSLDRSNYCPNCGAYMKGGETVAENDLHNPGP